MGSYKYVGPQAEHFAGKYRSTTSDTLISALLGYLHSISRDSLAIQISQAEIRCPQPIWALKQLGLGFGLNIEFKDASTHFVSLQHVKTYNERGANLSKLEIFMAKHVETGYSCAGDSKEMALLGLEVALKMKGIELNLSQTPTPNKKSEDAKIRKPLVKIIDLEPLSLPT